MNIDEAQRIVSNEGFAWKVTKVIENQEDEVMIICKFNMQITAVIYSNFLKKVIAITRLHY